MRPAIAPVILAVSAVFVTFFLFFYAFQLVPYHAENEMLQSQHRAVMAYLYTPVFEFGDLGFMTEGERSHMRDVKALFDVAWFLMLFGLALTYVIVHHIGKRELFVIARKVGWSLLGFVCVVLLLASSGFDSFWTGFHHVLFPQGNWMFAADSALITLYPPDFFMLYTIAFLASLLLVGGLLLLVRPENVK